MAPQVAEGTSCRCTPCAGNESWAYWAPSRQHRVCLQIKRSRDFRRSKVKDSLFYVDLSHNELTLEDVLPLVQMLNGFQFCTVALRLGSNLFNWEEFYEALVSLCPTTGRECAPATCHARSCAPYVCVRQQSGCTAPDSSRVAPAHQGRARAPGGWPPLAAPARRWVKQGRLTLATSAFQQKAELAAVQAAEDRTASLLSPSASTERLLTLHMRVSRWPSGGCCSSAGPAAGAPHRLTNFDAAAGPVRVDRLPECVRRAHTLT